MSPRRTWIRAALCLVAFSPLSPSQSWKILDEIEFAKNMARYRLFTLAGDYLSQVGSRDLDGEDRQSLLYAKAAVNRYGGDFADTAEKRLAFYAESTRLYQEFLSKADQDHPNRGDARTELATTNRNLGALYVRLVQADIDKEASKKAAEDAFRECVKTLNTIAQEKQADFEAFMDQAEDLTEEDISVRTVQAFLPVSEVARAYFEWAQLYDQDEFNREDYLTKCIEKAEEFVWEVGTNMFLSYEAYYVEALAYMKLGKMDEARTYLDFIINKETGLPTFFVDGDGNRVELGQNFVDLITALMERCYLAQAENLNNLKDYEGTVALYDKLQEFYKEFKDSGVKPTDTGDEVQLELGMAEFRLGKATGMPRVQAVAERHPFDAIGTKAKQYISTILEGGGIEADKVIPPSIWMAGAETDRAEGHLLDSIEKYHRAIAALDMVEDAEEKRVTALEAWSGIGNIYRTKGRLVEAAIAFEQGLQLAGDDLEAVERVGVAWYNTLLARQRETKSKRVSAKKDQAMVQLARMGIENMAFLVAKDDFEAARILPKGSKERGDAFKEATSKLKDVKKGDINYERALVYQARCLGEQGKFEDALKKLATLEKWIADPKNDPGLDRKKIQAREIAETEATYYASTYLAELGRHEEVLTKLAGFEQRFASQDKFFKGVNYQRLLSLVGQKPPKLSEADALYEAKKDSELPDAAQFYVANAYLEVGRAEGTAPDRKKELVTKGAEHLFDYCQRNGFNSYTNTKSAADAYFEVENWDQAISSYLKIIDAFDGQKAYQDQIDQVVKLRLAEVYLAKRAFSKAAPLFKQLAKTNQSKPFLKQAGRCYGGWLDIDANGQLVEVPGSGDYKEAVEVWQSVLVRGYRNEDKFSVEWYKDKFFTIYVRYRASEEDPSFRTQAQDLINNLFTTTLGLFNEDEMKEVLGGMDWMRRWNYLRDRLR